MKKNSILLFTLFISFSAISQIKFEPGYYIDNEGNRTECLIKNIDWRDNPTAFENKTTADSEKLTVDIENVQEFGITNLSNYKRFKVNLDRSGIMTSMLSKNIEPEFNEETLFLKSLVEGKANLYMYNEDNLRRYFYSLDGSDVEQLIYKKYRINVDTAYNSETLKYGDKTEQIRENNKFKQQLWVGLQCADITMKDAENLNYNKKDLINYFLKYNTCVKSDFVNFEENGNNKNLFNLYIRPGFNYSSLSIHNTVTKTILQNTDFGYRFSFRIGLEAEIIAPFNKNKWAFFIEPTYHDVRSEQEITYLESGLFTKTTNVTFDHRSIELLSGLRYYMFLSKNSKLYVNFALINDFILNSVIDFEIDNLSDLYPAVKATDFGYGIGFNYRSKYSIELKYRSNSRFLANYPYWNVDYKIFSVVLGYRLF